jgi:hypothetical protein
MRRDLIFNSYPEDSAYGQWILLGIGLAGVIAGVSVAIFADKGSHPWWLPARCSMGFLVAVVWIMAIADEVVSILQVSEGNVNTRSKLILVDLRLHFWTVGCYRWFDDFRCGKFYR